MTPPKHIADLLRAGAMLSNAADVLAQADRRHPNEYARTSLHESRKAWDAAVNAHREASKVPPPNETPRALRALAAWCRRQAKRNRDEGVLGAVPLAYEHVAAEAEARARKLAKGAR